MRLPHCRHRATGCQHASSVKHNYQRGQNSQGTCVCVLKLTAVSTVSYITYNLVRLTECFNMQMHDNYDNETNSEKELIELF